MGCSQSSPRDEALGHPAVAADDASRLPSANAASASQQSRATQRLPSRSILGNRSNASGTSAQGSALRTNITQLEPPQLFTSSNAPPPLLPTSHTSSTSTGSRRWRRSDLIRERRIFFETRVTGRAEVWQAVQLAVEMGRDGGDWAGATGLVEAAGCTITISELIAIRRRDREREGSLGHIGVWDERGEQYRCPLWVWGDPADIVEDGVGGQHVDGDGTDVEPSEGEDEEDVGDKEGAGLQTMTRRVEEKGKEKLVLEKDDPDAISLRARLSDRGNDVVLLVRKDWTVKTVVRRIIEEGDYPAKTKMKLGYLGRVLKDNETLEAQGWAVGHVINVFVFQ